MKLNRRHFLISSAAAMGATALPFTALGQNTTSLGFKLFDTHAHLVSLDLTSYPRADNDGGGASNIDPKTTPTVDNLIAWMDANGVEAAAVVQKKGTYGYDNRYIIDSSTDHPDRLTPVVVLDSLDPNTGYILDGLVPQGIAAVRFTGPQDKSGGFPWLTSDIAKANWAMAEKHGIGIELMYVPPGTNPGALKAIAQMAKSFPGVKIVLDHLGWPGQNESTSGGAPSIVVEGAPNYGLVDEHLALAELKNVYYKLTPLNLDDVDKSSVSSADWVRHMVDVFGADHIMWGSNIGQSPGVYPTYIEQGIRSVAKLSEMEKRLVMHDTGKRFHTRS